jgi:hypothetical protein
MIVLTGIPIGAVQQCAREIVQAIDRKLFFDLIGRLID